MFFQVANVRTEVHSTLTENSIQVTNYAASSENDA